MTTTTNGTTPRPDTSPADARQKAINWWVTAIGIVRTLQCQATDLMLATSQPDSPVFQLFSHGELDDVRHALEELDHKLLSCTPNPGLVDTELLPEPV